MADPACVYIIDDDDDLRESLIDLLSTRTPWKLKAYSDGPSWLEEERSAAPGCVLLDFSMPEMTGMQVLQEMQRRKSPHQVVMLTGEGNIALAVEAMRNGATDFIEKPVLFEQLESAIVDAIERLSSSAESRARTAEAEAKVARLKPREQDVMMGLVEGHPNKMIAYKLGLSVRTVELYRAALMDRLAVDSVADILKIAFAAKLINS